MHAGIQGVHVRVESVRLESRLAQSDVRLTHLLHAIFVQEGVESNGMGSRWDECRRRGGDRGPRKRVLAWAGVCALSSHNLRHKVEAREIEGDMRREEHNGGAQRCWVG